MTRENEPSVEGEKDSRFVADFWPTGRCDMECPFCYGSDAPSSTIEMENLDGGLNRIPLYSVTSETEKITGSKERRPEMSIDQMKHVVLKLKEVGVDTLNIGGGEPLLRRETPEIVRFASQVGLEVYVSTNATYLARRYVEIKDNISVLGLPFDGSTPQMNGLMGRNEYVFHNVQNFLAFLKDTQPQHKLKIGTIVSRINMDDIEAIGRLLFQSSQIYSPDVWRIYQFEPLKRGVVNREMYEIGDSQFGQICDRLRALFPEVMISPRSNSDHSNAYFFITPDGMLQAVHSRHESIADLLRIDKDDLSRVITEHKKTKFKASKNREWMFGSGLG